MGITQIDVVEAAEKIVATGDHPTIEKVRLQLGMGSNTTISKYLNDWRAKREVLQGPTPSNQPPDPVNAAVQQVWLQMQEKTQIEIKEIQEKAQEEITSARNELQLALDARDILLQQISELEKRNNQLQADKEILAIDLKSSEEAKKVLQEKHIGLQKQHDILGEQTRSRIEELKNELILITQNHQQNMIDLKNTNENALRALIGLHDDERHRQIIIIDELKIKEKNHFKLIQKLENDIYQLKLELTESKSCLNVIAKEKKMLVNENNNKDEIIATLKQWNNFEETMDEIQSDIKKNFKKLFIDQDKLVLYIDEKLKKAIDEFSHAHLVTTE